MTRRTASRSRTSASDGATTISSVLAEVPGLGASRIKVLLKHFGSVTALRAAEPGQIEEVQGIGPVLAQNIHSHLSTR